MSPGIGVQDHLTEWLPGPLKPRVSLFEIERLLEDVGTDRPPWFRSAECRRWRRLVNLLGTDRRPSSTDLERASAMAAAVATVHTSPDHADLNLGGSTWTRQIRPSETRPGD